MRGNIVLADHGLTTQEIIPLSVPVPSTPPFRPAALIRSAHHADAAASVQYDPTTGRLATPRTDLDRRISATRNPRFPCSLCFRPESDLWKPVSDLLESSPFDTEFVPELDNDQGAVLRFGDDEYGQSRLLERRSISATYRIGNGLAGNVGAESLAHVAVPLPFSGITLVRNPLPASEAWIRRSIADVQQWAPEAFRAVQFRAVTEADYARAAQLMPQVQSAVASFRWTGSWYTVFIGILPSAQRPDQPAERRYAASRQRSQQNVTDFLDGYRLAGLRPGNSSAAIPAAGNRSAGLRGDRLFPQRCRTGGRCRAEQPASSRRQQRVLLLGNFVFGQPVYLSQIYAAAQAVEGVDSVVVTSLAPFGQPDNGELAHGVIPVGPWQIARLDNDPNFMERGVLKINMRGGKL